MIRIGVVNIDVSHPLAFSGLLNAGSRARYVAVYNDGFRGDDEVEAFIRRAGLEKRCQSVEELADMCDVGFIQGCNWDKHLDYAEIFIGRGKPVFIDKPIVGCMKDIRRLEALHKGGAVILGSSSLRYASEITAFLEKPVEERGEIINIMGTCGVDEFNYAIHVVESIGAMAKDAVSCRYAGSGTAAGNTASTYLVTFANGVTATYITVEGVWLPCDFLVTTTKGVYPICVDTGAVYIQLLNRICDYMETGKSDLAQIPDIIESIKIMLAGRLSKQNGGQPVRLDDIPENDPGFDGAAFETGYAAAAKKIYLD